MSIEETSQSSTPEKAPAYTVQIVLSNGIVETITAESKKDLLEKIADLKESESEA